jgi:hypothetical protein
VYGSPIAVGLFHEANVLAGAIWRGTRRRLVHDMDVSAKKAIGAGANGPLSGLSVAELTTECNRRPTKGAN